MNDYAETPAKMHIALMAIPRMGSTPTLSIRPRDRVAAINEIALAIMMLVLEGKEPTSFEVWRVTTIWYLTIKALWNEALDLIEAQHARNTNPRQGGP